MPLARSSSEAPRDLCQPTDSHPRNTLGGVSLPEESSVSPAVPVPHHKQALSPTVGRVVEGHVSCLILPTYQTCVMLLP